MRSAGLVCAGAVGALVVLSACGGGSGQVGASPFPSAEVSASASASASVVVSASASPSVAEVADIEALGRPAWELTETGERSADGYHLNGVVPGAPTVILYMDLECSDCARVNEAYGYAAVALDGMVNVTVKHFPVPSHDNALVAAQAVQAAEAQGAYAQMLAYLLERQEEWAGTAKRDAVAETFAGYAEELGLDRARFEADMADEDLFKVIQQEYNDGKAIEVLEVPWFTVDGKPVAGADASSTAEELVAAFRAATGV